MSTRRFVVPLILRGRVISDDLIEHKTRQGGTTFETPDVRAYLDDLPADGARSLLDLHQLSVRDIAEFLAELGPRLKLDENPHLAEAFELSCITSGLTKPVLERIYGKLPQVFAADYILDIADSVVGIKYLDGWVPRELADGSRFSVRAFGPRMVNILAGNVPLAGAGALIRSAVVRADVILKAPSNDPATAAAIVRTMAEMAPDHPVTRHVSVVYWKGGDETVEDVLYDPARVEKIFATGGEASMRHIRKYLRPGLDLIAADPKLSATIVGRAALESDDSLRDVAGRIARDIGSMNQEACVNARVVYVESGTDDTGLERLRRLGQLTYEALQGLSPDISSPVQYFDPDLRDSLDSLALSGDWYELIGAERNEGGVVVSLIDEPVDFADSLSCRVGNLVPVDDLARAMSFINNYTQTIGIYPPELKEQLRDDLSVFGAQRLVTLGHATDFTYATPADGMEPLRRVCKWIVDEDPPPGKAGIGSL